MGKLSTTDKIDRVVTNRWLALPIFALVMWLVYYVAMVTIGASATDWANDCLFGDGYHLFGIGGSAYEAAAEEYGDTAEILGAAEAGEKTYVTIDDETMEVSDPIEITDDMLAEAKAMEEKYGEEGPDPADYGVWVPGIPVLIERGLDAVYTFQHGSSPFILTGMPHTTSTAASQLSARWRFMAVSTDL